MASQALPALPTCNSNSQLTQELETSCAFACRYLVNFAIFEHSVICSISLGLLALYLCGTSYLGMSACALINTAHTELTVKHAAQLYADQASDAD